jgi:hypothetical protein
VETLKLFRLLIWASVALMGTTITMVAFETDPPDHVMDWFTGEGAGPLMSWLLNSSGTGLLFFSLFAAAFFGAWIASVVGLLRLRPWGRKLFIASMVVAYLLFPLMGYTFASPAQGTLDAMFYACDGAILVMLFIEPVRSSFRSSPAAG